MYSVVCKKKKKKVKSLYQKKKCHHHYLENDKRENTLQLKLVSVATDVQYKVISGLQRKTAAGGGRARTEVP